MVSLVSFPEKAILKVILSQTQMFNLFPVHVDLSSIMNILSGICTRATFCYIPSSTSQFSKFFLDLLYENSNNCLTVDCREINKGGSAKFRTVVDSLKEQWCYLNISCNVKQCNTNLKESSIKILKQANLISKLKTYWKGEEW